ncbi:MAG: MOSC domain-containing protein [Pseudomonadota bacterium]
MAPVRVSSLWRHPIKAHGAEPLTASAFVIGETMPWDRVWAIAHEASKVAESADTDWVPCANFSRGAKSPSLMAVRARTDEASGRIALEHPDAMPIEVDLDNPSDAAKLIEWVLPLSNQKRALPKTVVRTKSAGLTDSKFPSIAILNKASLSELSAAAGQDLAEERFRGNIWLDGLEPWQEFDFLDRSLKIGSAEFVVRERITRCMATASNPATGRIDLDTLRLLEANWGHQDFGIYAEVTQSGQVRVGDAAQLV